MKEKEIEGFEFSKDPRIAIHIYILNRFDFIGYEETQKEIRENLNKLKLRTTQS